MLFMYVTATRTSKNHGRKKCGDSKHEDERKCPRPRRLAWEVTKVSANLSQGTSSFHYQATLKRNSVPTGIAMSLATAQKPSRAF